ncbi:hypothetical protein AVEN_64206-1 [Araneus ventricosus]|uniref:Uncharacterized protein n=1 Tax=Araneus ventricosus TaxID=182803 RepID=A0A4Y2VVR4_ARAVE|nr:hypothetical protein AVEN_64206-1 [Araneus ventricosus]
MNEEIQERRRQEEIVEQKWQEEIAEQKPQEEIQIAERRRQEEIERRKLEYEEQSEKKNTRNGRERMKWNLSCKKYVLEQKVGFSNSIASQNVNSTQIKPKLELHHLMAKFNSDENDIGLYLIMLECLAKQAEIFENTWVTHLLGLLPYDVAQLIAREPDEIANNYNEVKKILLKRYKLTPEKFRQKFFMHNKNLGNTWKNFTYGLRSFLMNG